MHTDRYRSILAGHELVGFDYVKRRVGSQAISAAHELSAIETDIMLSLPDEEYARLRALEPDLDLIPEDPNPVDDAELAFKQEVHDRFDPIDGYSLYFAKVDEGLSLLKFVHEDGLDAATITLSCPVPVEDALPVITKTRRGQTPAGDRVRQALEVTDDDKRIIEEAFARLAKINDELKNA